MEGYAMWFDKLGARTTVTAAVALLVLSACGVGSPQSSTGEKRVLRVGIGAYPASFNPNLARSAPGFSMHRAIMDTLTEADASKGGQLSPALATSWKLVDDTTWEFKLPS